MNVNGFSTLRSLLSAEPCSASVTPPMLSDSNNNNDNFSKKTSICKELNQKQKKKAAFDDWHKRKLDELQRKCSSESSPSPVDDRCESESPRSVAAETPKANFDTSNISVATETDAAKDGPSNICLIQQLVRANAALPSVEFTAALFPNTNRSAAVYTPTRNSSNNLPEISAASLGKDLTSPKLSRHNDAAFYPNIQCILCKEWVCSRNRYMHIESHLQYRPYKCSLCSYDNRKKIFIELHINRVHKGASTVLYNPDPELEKRAWIMAEQCLQHTREVLLNGGGPATADVKQPKPREIPKQAQQSTSLLDKSLLAPYEDVYRPKIFNSQRNEKSQLIEESRQLGLVPDFSEVANREEKCRLCNSYILRIAGLLEEHVRSHVSQPTYQCSFDDCTIQHCSRNFLFRHMKEVHKTRKNVRDLIPASANLVDEFALLCQICFPAFYSSDSNALKRKLQLDVNNKVKRSKSYQSDLSSYSAYANNAVSTDCLACKAGFGLSPASDTTCVECRVSGAKVKGRLLCNICDAFVPGDFVFAQLHALEHFGDYPPPFSCNFCDFGTFSWQRAKSHLSAEHPTAIGGAIDGFDFDWSKNSGDWRAVWWSKISRCFDSETRIYKRGDFYSEFTCGLCCSSIKGDFKNLLDHTLKHLSCPKFGCLYCDFENGAENEIQVHLRLQHADAAVVVRIDTTPECLNERNRLMSLCFPDASNYSPSFSENSKVKMENSDPGRLSSKIILCKLCHQTLPSNECLHHVQRHSNAMSIFRCNFCPHKDIDCDRMKNHGGNLHKSSTAYTKVDLPQEFGSKFAQIVALCF